MQVELHDLYEDVEEPPLYEMDADDMHDLLGICYSILLEVSERKLPKALQADIVRTLQDLDEVLAWQRYH